MASYAWSESADSLVVKFQNAKPFPHVILDEFLDPGLASQVLEEFPTPDAMPRSRDYVFGSKRELSSLAHHGEASRRLAALLLGDEFARFLSTLWGNDVRVDPAFHGGGFHQGADGSFLDMHADFNVHPNHPSWHRVLNVLIYLNKDWAPEWDGRLLLTSSLDQPAIEIEPLFNRAVIMATGDCTYHGYRRMRLPAGITRKSVAAYAYETVAQGEIRARTTKWMAGDNDRIIKRLAARHYDTAVRVKNILLGSGTARNR